MSHPVEKDEATWFLSKAKNKFTLWLESCSVNHDLSTTSTSKVPHSYVEFQSFKNVFTIRNLPQFGVFFPNLLISYGSFCLTSFRCFVQIRRIILGFFNIGKNVLLFCLWICVFVALSLRWMMSMAGESIAGGGAAFTVASLCQIMTSLFKLTPVTQRQTVRRTPPAPQGTQA